MPRLWSRAAAAVMFHDLGKCCAGFQNTVRGGARFRHRHEVLSIALLPRLISSDPYGDIPWIAAAVLTHHKDLEEIGALYPDEFQFDRLDQLASEATPTFFADAEAVFIERFRPLLVNTCDLNFGVQPLPPPGSIEEAIRPILRTVSDLARRMRSQTALAKDAIAGRFLRGLLLLADHAGSAGERFGFLAQITSVTEMLSSLKLIEPTLFDHQRDVPGGNATLIAPTGSGKTEASMLWAARTASVRPGKPVIFYVLPYQASINAMQARLAHSFGHAKVTLQHSRAAQAVYRQLLDRAYEPSLAARLAKKERSLAQLHSKPVRILTPYQLLRGAFQLKGHEALWTDCAGSLMILDEIHAYESTRLGMILATLRHLTCELGVHALVMSATLPRRLLEILKQILPGGRHISASPGTFAQFRRHRVNLVQNDLLDPVITERVIADASRGMAVLVVATTVSRAQTIYSVLRRQLGETVSLLHGRFHAEDRFCKEKDLAQKRGPGGNAAIVLVATQVVEVSLDIDFDVLYSDPAPLESLVQRFGRINRRRRTALRDVFVMKVIPEKSPVYERHIVDSALSQLAAVDGEQLDESIVQEMLDSIYGGSTGDLWFERVRQSMDDFEKNVLKSSMPFDSSEELAARFDQMFDGYQVLPASLESEYIRRKEEDELSAPSLLIPITSGQFFALKPALRRGTFIVDRPYSSEEGLQLSGPHATEGL